MMMAARPRARRLRLRPSEPEPVVVAALPEEEHADQGPAAAAAGAGRGGLLIACEWDGGCEPGHMYTPAEVRTRRGGVCGGGGVGGVAAADARRGIAARSPVHARAGGPHRAFEPPRPCGRELRVQGQRPVRPAAPASVPSRVARRAHSGGRVAHQRPRPGRT
jgi:hypothetical protein